MTDARPDSSGSGSDTLSPLNLPAEAAPITDSASLTFQSQDGQGEAAHTYRCGSFLRVEALLTSAVAKLDTADGRSVEVAVLRNLLAGFSRISDFLARASAWEQLPGTERPRLLRFAISAGAADFARMRLILERENLLGGTANFSAQVVQAWVRAAERAETCVRILAKDFSENQERTARAFRLGETVFSSALRRFLKSIDGFEGPAIK
ncbi:MAG: hypothetical protein K1X83_06285 [Oligoflexia bacterium]|nr:hypothetical protein [Oligoflexia bacterium]